MCNLVVEANLSCTSERCGFHYKSNSLQRIYCRFAWFLIISLNNAFSCRAVTLITFEYYQTIFQRTSKYRPCLKVVIASSPFVFEEFILLFLTMNFVIADCQHVHAIWFTNRKFPYDSEYYTLNHLNSNIFYILFFLLTRKFWTRIKLLLKGKTKLRHYIIYHFYSYIIN